MRLPGESRELGELPSRADIAERDKAIEARLECRILAEGQVYGKHFEDALADWSRRGFSQRAAAQRLGITWRAFLKMKHSKLFDPIPISIDTLARLN